MKTGGNLVIYSRKSRFTGKGESIDNQIEMCRQYIRIQFGDDDADRAFVYEDEGFSGGTLERPQFQKMMKDAKQGGFRAIVVYRLDRISRNIGDFAKLIEQLNRLNIDFISIREQFDTSSPMGRAMMYISSVFSQLERETIAERIRDNMRELAKTGRWLGGITPTGYRSESITRVTVGGKTKRACKLTGIPEELALVRRIFDVFLATGSLTKTETYLLQNQYTTKNGNPFTRFAVKGILSNPVYLVADEAAYSYFKEKKVELFSEKQTFDGIHGIMAYNRTLQQTGKTHQVRPVEEWIVSVGEHKGVIDGTTWGKVQDLLEQNRSKHYRRPRSNVALLSGLLVCGNCGSYMRPKQTKRKNADGEPIYTYLCSLKERSRSAVCSVKNCDGNRLDADVQERIELVGEDRSELIRLLEQNGRIWMGDQHSGSERVTDLKTELSEQENAIKNLVSALECASGTSAEAYIVQKIIQHHEREEQLRRYLEEQTKDTDSDALTNDEVDRLAAALASFRDTIRQMTVEQKRAAVRALIRQVVWDGQNAHVIWVGADCGDLIRNRTEPKKPSGEDSK